MTTLVPNWCVFLRLRMSGPPGRRVRPPSSYGSMRTDSSSSSSSDIIEVGLGEEEEPAAADTGPAASPQFAHEKAASAPEENRYRLTSPPTPADTNVRVSS